MHMCVANMCLCINIYIYIYVCVCICVCICVCEWDSRMYECVYECERVCVHVNLWYVYGYIRICVWMVFTCTWCMHISVFICIYVCVYDVCACVTGSGIHVYIVCVQLCTLVWCMYVSILCVQIYGMHIFV